jgi:hypothetical protein
MKKQTDLAQTPVPEYIFKCDPETLMLPFPPTKVEVTVNGEVTVKFTTHFQAKFVDHTFKTKKPEVAEVLRRSKFFRNKSITELLPDETKKKDPAKPDSDGAQSGSAGGTQATPTAGTQAAPTAGAPDGAGKGDVVNIPGIKSKNAAVTYLITEKKVEPALLKGKTAKEVYDFALSQHKISFVDWKIQ